MIEENNKNFLFESFSYFNFWIERTKKEALFSSLFIVVFSCLVLYSMLFNNSNVLWQIFGIIGIVIFNTLFVYSAIIKLSKTINSTICSIERNDDLIIIKTNPYCIFNGKVGFKQKLFEVEIKKTEILETNYPMTGIPIIKTKVFQFSIGKEQLYLIRELFDIDCIIHIENLFAKSVNCNRSS